MAGLLVGAFYEHLRLRESPRLLPALVVAAIDAAYLSTALAA
jgi:hypothetical protein